MKSAIYYVAISSGALFTCGHNMFSRESLTGISLVFV